LARARLLEARGQFARACALLQRVSRRRPHDGVLHQLANDLAANPPTGGT
jgi:Flp pilus assembly protein TadD